MWAFLQMNLLSLASSLEFQRKSSSKFMWRKRWPLAPVLLVGFASSRPLLRLPNHSHGIFFINCGEIIVECLLKIGIWLVRLYHVTWILASDWLNCCLDIWSIYYFVQEIVGFLWHKSSRGEWGGDRSDLQRSQPACLGPVLTDGCLRECPEHMSGGSDRHSDSESPGSPLSASLNLPMPGLVTKLHSKDNPTDLQNRHTACRHFHLHCIYMSR